VTAAGVLEGRPHVLLDFDGPVCGVFEGVGDRTVSMQLTAFIARRGVVVRQHVADSNDPFEVLFFAATVHADLARAVHDELTRLEVEAVQSAPKTPGAVDVIKQLVQRGHTVTIVSNNSCDAVRSYLRKVDLDQHVWGVSARSADNLGMLKPNTFLLDEAMRHLGAEPGQCVMVGDSVSDVEAARSARVSAIAFANKPGKLERFEALAVDGVITTMSALVSSVVPR
jgi:HAD superfamily hydrolase (TIGR01662 family)